MLAAIDLSIRLSKDGEAVVATTIGAMDYKCGPVRVDF